MKKIFLSVCFCLFAFCLSYSQPKWQLVLDTSNGRNAYIDGGPIRALYSDTLKSHNQLLIGGEFDTLRWSSGISWYFPITYWTVPGSYPLIPFDCSPISDYGSGSNPMIINPSVWAIASVYNLNRNSVYFSYGGRFTKCGCSIPAYDASFGNSKNLQLFDPFDIYLDTQYMDRMDTIFAIAMSDSKYSPTCPDLNFKMYVASKCTFCFTDSSNFNPSRFISFYEPYQGCNYVARIDTMQGGTNGPVYSIQAIDTANVYAGGLFDSAGTIKANNIAKWNGASWDSLGSGTNGVVKALLAYNGNLYAGGNFTTAGGAPANNIAVWNGSNWSALGSGTNGAVYALTIHNGDLYAGGSFTQAGGNAANNIARWTGAQWQDVDGGRNDEVYALASFKGDLYTGGKFSGGKNDTAKYIARYTDTTLMAQSAILNPLSAIQIYPNPTTGIFSVSGLRSAISGLDIYNVMGEKVTRSIIPSSRLAGALRDLTIDISSQPGGIYFLRISTSEKIISKKIIIAR